MLISPELAAEQLGYNGHNIFWIDKKLSRLLVKDDGVYKVDTDKMDEFLEQKFKRDDIAYNTTNFAEYIITRIGIEIFYSQIPPKKVQYIKAGLKTKLSQPMATLINDIFTKKWRQPYDAWVASSNKYIPFKDRAPLSAEYIKNHYWKQKRAIQEIASELHVPSSWVYKEIQRLGLSKKKNNIKVRGRVGYIMPPSERAAHHNQPHAKKVSQIDPNTFEIVRTFRSIGATSEAGFCRENVKKAIQRVGLSGGYLWAHTGMEQPTIKIAQRRGNLKAKQQRLSVKPPSKETMYQLYIVEKLPVKEIARILGCSPATVPQYASKMGLKRKTPPVPLSTLKKLYLAEDLSAAEIARRYGKTKKTIATYLSRNGITKINKDTA